MTRERRFWRPAVSPVLAFRVVLVGLACSTLIGVTFALVSPDEFRAAFPGTARPVAYWALLTVGGTGLVAPSGLWRWRRWGVALYGLVALTSIALELVIRAPSLHQMAVVMGAWVVLGLAYAESLSVPIGAAG